MHLKLNKNLTNVSIEEMFFNIYLNHGLYVKQYNILFCRSLHPLTA